MDMLAGSFDSSLDKYKPQTHLLAVVEAIKPKEGLDLAQLWDKWLTRNRRLVRLPITKIL